MLYREALVEFSGPLIRLLYAMVPVVLVVSGFHLIDEMSNVYAFSGLFCTYRLNVDSGE